MKKQKLFILSSLCLLVSISHITAADRNLTKPTKEERQAVLRRDQIPTVVTTEPVNIDYDATHFGHLPPIITRKETLAALVAAAGLFVIMQMYRHDNTQSRTSYY